MSSIVQSLNQTLLNNVIQMSTSASHFIPRGTVFPFHGTEAPPGWHLCDGNGTYTTEGGDEVAIPDLRGRFILGAGTGSDLTSRALNDNGGYETHTLTANEMPTHTHNGTTASNGAHVHTHNANGGLGATGLIQATGSNTPGSIDNTGTNEFDLKNIDIV